MKPSLQNLVCLLILLAVTTGGSACAADPASVDTLPGTKSTYEATEWLSYRVNDADKTNLPRVLLIGDSICGSYTSGAIQCLKGKAYVSQLGTSKAICLPEYFEEIRMALRQSHYAVIHFNNGLHGWAYSEAEYGRNLAKLVELLKTEAPGAKLVWATTTQLRSSPAPFEKFAPNNDRVIARNAIAAEIMARNGIPTDDLYTLMVPHPHLLSDGTHYTPEGNAIISPQVNACLLKALNLN